MNTQTAQDRSIASIRNEIEAARNKRRKCNGDKDEYTRLGGYIAGLNVALVVVNNPEAKLPY